VTWTLADERREKLRNDCDDQPDDYDDRELRPVVRTFETGANRDVDDDKLDYEGFLSPAVLHRFAEYMHTHRTLRDGTLRASDNWQKGIPRDAYMQSAWRHFMDWWSSHREGDGEYPDVEAMCALMFNVMGYMHEVLREHT
jgi:hypothetical protein